MGSLFRGIADAVKLPVPCRSVGSVPRRQFRNNELTRRSSSRNRKTVLYRRVEGNDGQGEALSSSGSRMFGLAGLPSPYDPTPDDP